jgi:nicotinate-nucleotide--dimethylbenzimidazole phosphoribosyltransferase
METTFATPEPSMPPRKSLIDNFLELVRTRRSVRSGFLKDEPVNDGQIETILEAARWAPSGGNSQPWEFIVIRDPDMRDKIASLYKAQMRDKIEIEEAVRGRRSIVDPGLAFRYAPVFIIILGDPRTIEAYPVRTKLEKWESHFYSSLANCVLQLMLAAHALGLTTIYVSDVSSPYFSVMIKSLLNVPDPLQVYQLVPVGFAERSPTIHHPRRELKEMVHYERYDRSHFRSEEQVQTFMEEMSIRGSSYRF